jgi:hypothetical protein
MMLDLRIAGPALAQGIIGVLALMLVAFAAPEAICGGAVSGG